jgi:hypothetical protein
MMKNPNLTLLDRTWTASELRKLPAEQRDAILKEAAILAEEEYKCNRELTAFEAFSEADLHGDSSNTEMSLYSQAIRMRLQGFWRMIEIAFSASFKRSSMNRI